MVIKKKKTALKDSLLPRPPIVTVIGHVDHGKTTLLDKIRETNIAGGEAGGITQKIGAYEVVLKKNKKNTRITFLDTPGHEAFSGMRQRGIKVADIAILVVAADDGVQPQTIEAIKFAAESQTPIVVAFNKVDRPEADVARTKKQLSDNGVITEDWGGEILSAEISAKSGLGIENLLESVLLLSEMTEMKFNPNIPATGIILESKADSKKGILATFLVKDGILKIRDIVASGMSLGRIKRMENFKGETIVSAAAGTPVVIMGMESLPRPGTSFQVFKDFAEAQKEVVKNKEKEEVIPSLAETASGISPDQDGICLNLILKADSQGTLEALEAILKNLKLETVKIKILKKGVGDINENDIKEANVISSTIIGFNASLPASLSEFSKHKKVKIISGSIVYKLIEDLKELAASLLPPKIIKTITGKLQVIALFKSKKVAGDNIEAVFGAKVIDGKIVNGAGVEIFRRGVSVGIGKVVELQLNKEVVKEVSKPNNAGIHYRGKSAVEMGDTLEAYTEEIIKQKIE